MSAQEAAKQQVLCVPPVYAHTRDNDWLFRLGKWQAVFVTTCEPVRRANDDAGPLTPVEHCRSDFGKTCIPALIDFAYGIDQTE